VVLDGDGIHVLCEQPKLLQAQARKHEDEDGDDGDRPAENAHQRMLAARRDIG
jgi:hypothetical protein